jgi:leader peptidase (prepilin peptidase)/N-methyltransferase
VNHVLVAVGWGIIGAAAGWLVRWGSVKLATLEGLEPGHRRWQVWGPPILSAIIFAGLGYVFGAEPLLLLRSVFALVLVQVIFFDFEHRLILDRVLFPSIAAALLVSLFGNPWWAGPVTGVAAGLLFTFLALAGAFLFKTEVLGFGDVKLALFMGLLLGWPQIVSALFYGVFLAGAVSIGVIAWRRSLKGTIAYGPYLAAGALIVLFQMR